MEQKFNIFNQPEMPVITLCTPNLEKVHAIDSVIFDTNITLKYNAISEFEFKIPESIDGNNTTLFVYDLIKTMKYLHIENVGYFIILEVTEDDEGLVKIKDVQCESLESELKRKKMTGFERVSVPIVDSLVNVKYAFHTLYENDDPETFTIYYEPIYYLNGNQQIEYSEEGEGLMETIIEEYIPNWSIDTSKPIPEELITIGGESDELLIATIVRGFKISDTNLYSFLTADVEKAFGCAVIFNKEERTFYFENMNSIQKTNIFLSYDNLLKSSQVKEYSDEISTSLSCYGAKGMSINYANPLGNSKIYNFDYFKTTEWMSQDLIDLIDSWEESLQKEIVGTVGGNHPGEAWGEWIDYSVPSPYPEYTVRWLDLLYDTCLRYGESTLYPLHMRYTEIAGQLRLLKTVTELSSPSSFYKTNLDFMYAGTPGAAYPTVTDATYDSADGEECATVALSTSSGQYIGNPSQPSFPRRIDFQVDLGGTITGTVIVTGLHYNGAVLEEYIEFTGDSSASTTQNYASVMSIQVPQAGTAGLTLYCTYGAQIITAGVSITPTSYRIKNLYKWSTEGGIVTISNKSTTNVYESRINQAMNNLKKLESGEKYSNFVEYLFETYEEIYRLDVIKTYIENKIEEQEILKSAAIELQNASKKEDHATNIRWLKNFYIAKYDDTFDYGSIPYDGNANYDLNSDSNKLNLQELIDNGVYPGDYSEGTKGVGESNSITTASGGLHQTKTTILSLEYYVERLGEIMGYISSSLDLENFFGSLYIDGLSPFIIENTYQNEYSVNYSGEIKDKIATSVDLYEQSLGVSERTSSPRYEIDINAVNFINLFEYKDSFIPELDLGKKITINIKDSLLEVILLELKYSFSNLEEMDITFGNRLRLDDVRFQYTDFVGQIYKTGSQVSFDNIYWDEFSKSYKIPVEFMIDKPVFSVNSISDVDLSEYETDDQSFEISITKSGLKIRKKLDDDNYAEKQLLLTNGVIAYTTDDWTNITYK